ncbi:O-antigen ligase [Brevundimonas sp.]|uniref:O-antigen ligase family protein n=1 Tax=Brevundimonas sp. TaxID=1871086 RepID=UPI0025D9671D|nr:O-antigen ligase [Brevundimonas sp.]
MSSLSPALHPDVARTSRREDARLTLSEGVALATGFMTLFILLQGWSAPLTGWSLTAENSALLRNAFWPAYGFTLVLLAQSWRETLRALMKSAPLLVLVGLAFASTFWSIDSEATFRRSVALLFTCLAGFVIAARWRWRTVAELIAGNIALLAVLSFLIGALLPAYGRMEELFPGSWRGVYTEKNALGGIMALGVCVSVASAILAPRRRLLWIASVLLCLLLVLLSTSKTALVAMALGLAAMGWVWIVRRGPVSAVAFTWIAAVGVFGLAGAIVLAPEFFFDLLGKDATLTGRTEIWEAAIRQGELKPMWGYGYGVLWDHMRGFYPGAWIAHQSGFIAGHAHNSWIEVWLALGWVGLALWSLYWLVVMGQAIGAAYRHPGAYLALPLLVMISLRSLTEVPTFDYHDGEWTLFVTMGAALVLGWRELDRAP